MAYNSALIIVDMQNDFCPGGSLAVAGGDKIVPLINRYIEHFHALGSAIIASRDWHPSETRHFRRFGGIWPEHCIQGTSGAKFRDGLAFPENLLVFSKGMDPGTDDYSALQAKNEFGITMTSFLRMEGVQDLYLCGLATDFCVLHTAIEGTELGFSVNILLDAVRGVEINPGDSERALGKMASAGAELLTIGNLQE